MPIQEVSLYVTACHSIKELDIRAFRGIKRVHYQQAPFKENFKKCL